MSEDDQLIEDSKEIRKLVDDLKAGRISFREAFTHCIGTNPKHKKGND